MYKSQKDIDDWVKAFNKREVKRMKKDDPDASYEDLDFRGGGEWGLEVFVPQAILDLLPEWESSCWWELDIVMEEDAEAGDWFFELEHEALDEYGVKSIDEINAHFARRFYRMTDEEEEWWMSLEKEIKGKTGLPFEEIRVSYA